MYSVEKVTKTSVMEPDELEHDVLSELMSDDPQLIDDDILQDFSSIFDQAFLDESRYKGDYVPLDEIELDPMKWDDSGVETNSSPNASADSLDEQYQTPPQDNKFGDDIIFFCENEEEDYYEDDMEPVPMPKKTTRPYRKVKPRQDKHFGQTSLSNLNNEDLDQGKPGQLLYLSPEERHLLIQGGHRVPVRLPLTKIEDRILRTVRRRIRNKMSAKASRAKKQGYMVDMEKQLKRLNDENTILKKQVNELKTSKSSLIATVRRLSNAVSNRVFNRQNSNSDDTMPMIGKHRLTSPDIDQKYLLPVYTDRESTINNKKSRKSNTHTTTTTSLFMFAFVMIGIGGTWLMPLPTTMNSELPEYAKHSNAPNGRILLRIGPKTLEEFNNETQHEIELPDSMLESELFNKPPDPTMTGLENGDKNMNNSTLQKIPMSRVAPVAA